MVLFTICIRAQYLAVLVFFDGFAVVRIEVQTVVPSVYVTDMAVQHLPRQWYLCCGALAVDCLEVVFRWLNQCSKSNSRTLEGLLMHKPALCLLCVCPFSVLV